MKQLIDFKGVEIDGYICPTDIDGLIEYKNSEYVIFEIKYAKTGVPFRQKLALQRMVDDFTKAGKRAIVLICEHRVKNCDKSVIAAKCKVREFYYGEEKEWMAATEGITVTKAINMFRKNKCNEITTGGKAT